VLEGLPPNAIELYIQKAAGEKGLQPCSPTMVIYIGIPPEGMVEITHLDRRDASICSSCQGLVAEWQVAARLRLNVQRRAARQFAAQVIVRNAMKGP